MSAVNRTYNITLTRVKVFKIDYDQYLRLVPGSLYMTKVVGRRKYHMKCKTNVDDTTLEEFQKFDHFMFVPSNPTGANIEKFKESQIKKKVKIAEDVIEENLEDMVKLVEKEISKRNVDKATKWNNKNKEKIKTYRNKRFKETGKR